MAIMMIPAFLGSYHMTCLCKSLNCSFERPCSPILQKNTIQKLYMQKCIKTKKCLLVTKVQEIMYYLQFKILKITISLVQRKTMLPKLRCNYRVKTASNQIKVTNLILILDVVVEGRKQY